MRKRRLLHVRDITAAVAEVAGDQVDTLANLDDQVGLPKVRRDAGNVARDLAKRNVDFKLIGGLDEYPVTVRPSPA